MPKRRQTRTSQGKKKRRLPGLSPQEAHTRAVKAWKTKHSRYKYGQKPLAAADWDKRYDQVGSKRRRERQAKIDRIRRQAESETRQRGEGWRLVDEKVRLARAEEARNLEAFRQRQREERSAYDSQQEEYLSRVARDILHIVPKEGPTEVDVREQAAESQRYMDFTDPDFNRWLRSQSGRRQREATLGLLRYSELQDRIRRRRELGRGRVGEPGDASERMLVPSPDTPVEKYRRTRELFDSPTFNDLVRRAHNEEERRAIYKAARDIASGEYVMTESDPMVRSVKRDIGQPEYSHLQRLEGKLYRAVNPETGLTPATQGTPAGTFKAKQRELLREPAMARALRTGTPEQRAQLRELVKEHAAQSTLSHVHPESSHRYGAAERARGRARRILQIVEEAENDRAANELANEMSQIVQRELRPRPEAEVQAMKAWDAAQTRKQKGQKPKEGDEELLSKPKPGAGRVERGKGVFEGADKTFPIGPNGQKVTFRKVPEEFRKESVKPTTPDEEKYLRSLTRPVREHRRSDISVEDQYHFTGHEAKRGWEGIKGQYNFIKVQQQRRARLWRTGDVVGTWNRKGQRTAFEKGGFGVGPNKEYEYTVKPSQTEDIFEKVRIHYGDTKDYFDRGDTDKRGRPLPGSHDPLVSEEIKPIFTGNERARVTAGTRTLPTEIKRALVKKQFGPNAPWYEGRNVPPGIAREAYVPIPGVPLHFKDYESRDPRDRVTVYENIKYGRRGGSTRRIQGKHRVYYGDPSLFDMGTGQFDLLQLRTPKKGRIGERVAYVNFSQGGEATKSIADKVMGEHLSDVFVTGHTPLNSVLMAPKFGQARRKLDERSKRAHVERVSHVANTEVAKLDEIHGRQREALEQRVRTRIHAKGQQLDQDPSLSRKQRKEQLNKFREDQVNTLNAMDEQHDRSRAMFAASAGVAVAGLRKQIRRGAPNAVNTRAAKVARRVLGAKRYQEWNIPEKLVDTYEGFIPISARIANKKDMLSHPLTSVGGVTAGFETDPMYYRTKWIKESTRRARVLGHERKRLEHVGQTLEYLDQPGNSPLRKLARWRRKGLMSVDMYKEDKFLNRLQYIKENENLLVTSKEKLHPKISGEHAKLLNTVEKLEGQATARKARLLSQAEKSGSAVAIRSEVKGASIASRNHSLVIGGALVGTAIGAHYLYHRHQQKKLPEGERTAYYNKILPKPFNVTTPHVSVKMKEIPRHPVTNELLLGGKNVIPVGIDAGLRKREIKLRPSDRGYDPHLPLIGGIRGKPKGAGKIDPLSRIVIAEGAQRKRSYRRGTHEILVKQRRVPLYIDVGKQQEQQLSKKNSKALTPDEKKRIAQVHADYTGLMEDRAREQRIRNMYQGDPIIGQTLQEARVREIERLHKTVFTGPIESLTGKTTVEQLKKDGFLPVEEQLPGHFPGGGGKSGRLRRRDVRTNTAKTRYAHRAKKREDTRRRESVDTPYPSQRHDRARNRPDYEAKMLEAAQLPSERTLKQGTWRRRK